MSLPILISVPDSLCPAPRRTQTERRESTRRALLDATIASLVECGYARTTTTEVTKRAGVSQGALFKHFPTKSALVSAAAEQLFADLFVEFGEAFAHASTQDAPLVVAIHKLWDVFCRPELLAVYRLYAEAPMDPELLACLVPVVKQHQENIRACACELFPDLASSELARALFGAVVYAMQGLSMQRSVHVDPAEEALVLEKIEELARLLLAGGKPT